MENKKLTYEYDGNKFVMRSGDRSNIRFRNFSGAPTMFNAKGGERTFCLTIEDLNVAEQMHADGWNIKELQPRDPEDSPLPYIQVKVNFAGFNPPKIVLITSRNKVTLDETMVECLDQAEIRRVMAAVRPYHWNVRGDSGVSAYLKTLYVEIEEDEFEAEFAEDESPEE